MSNARNLSDIVGGNFDIPAGSLDNAVPANGSITTAKLADDAVTTAKIADTISGAHTFSGGLTLSGTTTHSGALNVTGATTTENGFNLLSSYDQTSAVVNLNSDTEIHDFGSSGLSKYKQFLVQTILQNESNGTMHVYFRYQAANGSNPTFQGQLNGQGSQASSNTPFQGDGDYVRTAFRLAQNSSMVTRQLISNPKGKTDVANLYNILYETQWVYSGVQTSHAQGSVRGTNTTSATQKVILNCDPGDSGGFSGNANCRVMSWAWGVGIA